MYVCKRVLCTFANVRNTQTRNYRSEHRILRSNVVAAVALSHELRRVAVAAFLLVGAAIVRRSQVKLECLAAIGSSCRWSKRGAAITVGFSCFVLQNRVRLLSVVKWRLRKGRVRNRTKCITTKFQSTIVYFDAVTFKQDICMGGN